MPSPLKGKTLVLTGCTSGIGEAVAHVVAPLGLETLILLNRSKQKADALVQTLRGLPNSNIAGDVHSVIADLGEPEQVQRAVGEIHAILEGGPSGGRLDFLVSNAGIYQGDMKKFGGTNRFHALKNSSGQEIHFATNYLSMVVLAEGLRANLEKATENTDGSCPGRIIITGSFTSMEMLKGVANLKNLQGESIGTRTKDKAQIANDIMYPQSKLLQHMWARWFARETSEERAGRSKRLHVVVWCPGAVVSGIDAWVTIQKMLGCFFGLMKACVGLRDPAMAAEIAKFLVEQPPELFDGCENGEPGLYCDCGKANHPQPENKILDEKGNPKNVDKGTCLMGRLDTYPTFKFKKAPSTGDWGQIEELVKLTKAVLGNPE